MTKYHAVMLDETNCEFGADVEANSRTEAYELLHEDYPESTIIQVETPEQAQEREDKMYQHIMHGGDWDEDGRPIYPAGYEYDEEEDDE